MELNEAIDRWAEEILPSKQLFLDALNKHQLTIYHGVDPTGPDLHLGHSTNYLLMRALQDAGNKVILLIGDFTAKIGDPSDKTAARKKLSEEEIKRNLATYKEQIRKIMRLTGKNPVEIKFNNEWLGKLTTADILELTAHFTYQQLIEREMFQRRIKQGKSVFMHELLYPLFQGYDSVAMEVDAEIGGSDQLFNMMVGRKLVKQILNKEKFVITTPLLVNPKTDKKLMSKSEGNYVALNDKPEIMFGKIMALPDETINPCFLLCTILPDEEIQSIENKVQLNEISIMDAKKRLAWEIVKLYHGEVAATHAQNEFEEVYQKKSGLPSKTPFEIEAGEWNITDALVTSGASPSRSDAKRLITGGGTEVFTPEGTNQITDPKTSVIIKPDTYIRVGKKRFIKGK